MIISCPNCGTRYQVAYEAIGAAGRKVQCAQCRKAWQASPIDDAPAPPPPPRPVLVHQAEPEDREDTLFSNMSESGLDDAFAEEERAMAVIEAARRAAALAIEAAQAAPAATEDEPRGPATRKDWAYARRQALLFRQLPFARARRLARSLSMLLLVLLVGSGLTWRTEIVRQFPELAVIYEGLGLGVNVVGLQFRDLQTVVSHHLGARVIEVEAKIVSISDKPVPVPDVLVTFLDSHGVPAYEWSVAPDAPDMEPGELLMFKTQIAAPPETAQTVRLTFDSNQNRPLPSLPADAKKDEGEH